MKKTPKTAQQRAHDKKQIRNLTKQLHKEAFELVQEFKEEWHCHCDIAEISAGLLSRMLNLSENDLKIAKIRASQNFTGENFADDTTWKGCYDEN